MAKVCPLTNEKVLYLECLECEEKECRKDTKHNTNLYKICNNTKQLDLDNENKLEKD